MTKKRIALLEILIFLVSIFCYIWLIKPLQNYIIAGVSLTFMLAIIIFSNVYHHDSLKKVGLRLDSFVGSAREVGLITLPLLALFLLIAFNDGNIRFGTKLVWRSIKYLPWAFAQQYVLQSFLNNRLQDIFRNHYIIAIISGFIFSLVHLPNYPLMLLTLIGGIIWSFVFCRHPNLIPLSISHSLLAVFSLHTLSDSFLPTMKIGLDYLMR